MKYLKYLIAVIFILGISFIPLKIIKDQNSEKIETNEQEKVLQKQEVVKSIEIDLTNNIINLKENENIIKKLPIAYQAKEGNWFQTPTGNFKVGVMDKNKRSSLSGVNMPYAIQFYEDYFIHDIPFYDDGIRLTSEYSGGCIRLETEYAKELFEFAEKDISIIIYKTINGYKLKNEYHEVVKLNDYLIGQDFNNPLKSTHKHGGDLDKISLDYIQHTGIDFSPKGKVNLSVYSISDGIITGIWKNGKAHGLGNTLIIDYGEFHALYGHLDSFEKDFVVGGKINKGDVLGEMGNTGYGCNYWRIGKDGCDSENLRDNHLHFEIKTKSVLENPIGKDVYYGYTPNNPKDYGYKNPMEILFTK